MNARFLKSWSSGLEYASGDCEGAKGQSLGKAYASVLIIIIIANHDQAVHVCACL